MCFSVNVNLVKDELENRFGVVFPDHERFQPSFYYHAFGLPEIPAISMKKPTELKLFKWGLIPSWTRTLTDANEIRYKTFNARAEGVRTKPSFSKSFKSGRCIIPVKGFFEWQHVGKIKVPWYIYHADEEILALAGLSEQWMAPETREIFDTLTIITTEANELLADIHNSKKRMPVILDREGEKNWINATTDADEAFNLLKPCPSEFLKAHVISSLVNDRSANRNTPEVIRPYTRTDTPGLF